MFVYPSDDLYTGVFVGNQTVYMLIHIGSDGVMRGDVHILRYIVHSYQGNNIAHDYMSILDIHLYAPPDSFEYIS